MWNPGFLALASSISIADSPAGAETLNSGRRRPLSGFSGSFSSAEELLNLAPAGEMMRASSQADGPCGSAALSRRGVA